MKKRLLALLLCVLMTLTVGSTALGEETKKSWEEWTDPYTLTWFAVGGFSYNFDPDQFIIDKRIHEELGITVEFTSGSGDKLAAMIAADMLPDVVTTYNNDALRLTLENEGLCLSLEELSAQYAPEMVIIEQMANWFRNEKDGKWYAYCNYYYPDEHMYGWGGYLAGHNMSYIREDLLAQLNLGIKAQDIRDKETLLKVLHAWKDSGLTYDGKTVYPFITASWSEMAEQFGMKLENAEGQYVDKLYTPEYKEAIMFANQLYREGLMNEEVITMNSETARDLIAAGQFFFVEHNWYVGAARSILYNNDPNAIYDYTGFIIGDGGDTNVMAGADGGGAWTSMITANAKDPARVIQFFAYMTQPENQINQQFGYEGWELKEDGKIYYTEEAKAKQFEGTFWNGPARTFVEFFNDYTVWQKYSPVPTPEEDPGYAYNIKETNRFNEFGGNYYSNAPFIAIYPPAGSDLAVLRTQIDTYWGQMQAQMIMAQTAEECSALYDQTLADIEAMGFAELTKYYNERFQANKEKLGVEFALPCYQ